MKHVTVDRLAMFLLVESHIDAIASLSTVPSPQGDARHALRFTVKKLEESAEKTWGTNWKFSAMKQIASRGENGLPEEDLAEFVMSHGLGEAEIAEVQNVHDA